jgi:phage/plasmid-like protein (TIGR03299 family)
MGHEIDQTVGKGEKAACFVVGDPAWHGLGKTLSKAVTVEEALTQAGADFEVGTWPMFVQAPPSEEHPNGQLLPSPRVATVRKDTGAVLGYVSDKYKVFQNKEVFGFLDLLVGSGEAVFESGGCLYDGRRTWVMARIPTEYRIAGNDVVHPYAVIYNSHDGSTCCRVMPTAVRVVCKNTASLATDVAREERKLLEIQHVGDLRIRIDSARKVLGLIDRKAKGHAEVGSRMAKVILQPAERASYFESVFPLAGEVQNPTENQLIRAVVQGKVQADDDTVKRVLSGDDPGDEFRSAVRDILNRQVERENRKNRDIIADVEARFHGECNSLPEIRGSLWAAYNAVSEYEDYRAVGGGLTGKAADDSRLNRILFEADAKTSAWREASQLLVTLAG